MVIIIWFLYIYYNCTVLPYTTRRHMHSSIAVDLEFEGVGRDVYYGPMHMSCLEVV